MALEIERKFLVDPQFLQYCSPSRTFKIRQCLIMSDVHKVVRVRISNEKGFLTIKSRNSGGVTRNEHEYEIPLEDAAEMIEMYGANLIYKVRHEVYNGDDVWEVDVYEGDNAGLIVAEIELESEDQEFMLPSWVRGEVTADKRYANSSLAINPFCNWRND